MIYIYIHVHTYMYDIHMYVYIYIDMMCIYTHRMVVSRISFPACKKFPWNATTFQAPAKCLGCAPLALSDAMRQMLSRVDKETAETLAWDPMGG